MLTVFVTDRQLTTSNLSQGAVGWLTSPFLQCSNAWNLGSGRVLVDLQRKKHLAIMYRYDWMYNVAARVRNNIGGMKYWRNRCFSVSACRCSSALLCLFHAKSINFSCTHGVHTPQNIYKYNWSSAIVQLKLGLHFALMACYHLTKAENWPCVSWL